MKKTVVVRVDSLKMHPKYKKQYNVRKQYAAHDESGAYQVGDVVEIQETRPLSRTKRWRVTRLVKRTESVEVLDSSE